MSAPWDDLPPNERLRVAATIASYLLSPSQGERPDPGLARIALDVGLGAGDFTPEYAKAKVGKLFEDETMRGWAGL